MRPSSIPRKALPEEHVCPRVCVLLALCALISALFFPFAVNDAHADIRKDDVIAGSTMEKRGLSASVCPSIDAQYAYVVDSNGEVFFERNADDATQIASITKIMTALVALENAPLDTKITVSSYAASVGESSAGLRAGDVLDLESALKALMIPSGNDAAIAIAECLGPELFAQDQSLLDAVKRPDGSSIAASDGDAGLYAFVGKMNVMAQELGCGNTVFENPHGLDKDAFEGHLHSTAEEVSKIASTAMQLEVFRSIVKTHDAVLTVERDGQPTAVEIESTDILLGSYEGACGIKTGFTERAGSCFAGACEREGRYLYAIVLDSSSDLQRFQDTKTLFDWVYDNEVEYRLAQSPETTVMTVEGQEETVPVVGRAVLGAWIDKTVPVTFKDPSAEVSVFRLDGNISQEFSFDDIGGGVRSGDVVGTATFYQHNSIVATCDLIACEDVPAPSIFEAVGIWWDRLLRNFNGEPTTAQSVVINETPLIFEK